MKPTLLISGCLIGLHCRYDGQLQKEIPIDLLMERYTLIPVCPEQLGGLSTPRSPAERKGDRVITADGTDVTEAFHLGALETLHLAKQFGCKAALLKKRSPSCGSGEIYDGSFTRTVTAGSGVTAALLQENGITVYDETGIAELLAT